MDRSARQRAERRGGAAAGRAGIALLATLLVVVLVAVIVAATVQATLTVTRTVSADYQSLRAFYAAEGGTEHALSRIEIGLEDGVLTDDELAFISAPSLEGFEFLQLEVVRDGPPTKEVLSDGSFSGMYSITQRLDITSSVTDASGAYGSLVLGAKAQAIPIFQFAVFFEGGFVDAAGSRKDMYGRVHSNRGFFLSGSDLHFHEVMTTPGGIYRDGMTYHEDPSNIGVYIEDASTNEVQLTFDSADTPDPEQFKARSQADFDARLRTGAFGTDSLRLPLPAGMVPRELIRPREAGDTESEMETKFAWKADMYVTVDLGSHPDKNTACGGVPLPSAPAKIPGITVTRPYGGAVPSDEWKCRIFDFEWEAFFDNAEKGWVDVLDVDVAELRDWMLPGNGGDSTRIIYVEFITAPVTDPGTTDPHNNGNFDDRYFPVLRVRNGAQLPGPLTLGSEYPLFVIGDYNSVNWKPSALFGDRLTALSNNWNDSDWCNQNDEWDSSCPDAGSHTAQYFAVVTGTGEGNIGCFHEDPACTTTPPHGPGGWVKMLEDWDTCGGRCVHTMIGSFISLSAPQIASPWGNHPADSYYRRPVRNWSFESRFEMPDSLPPGTPVVGQVLRAYFRESF